MTNEPIRPAAAKPKKKRKGWKVFLIVLAALVIASGGALGVYMVNNTYEYRWSMDQVWKAGFTEKTASVDEESKLNYVEGPDNGQDLLLIHGQAADWTSYAKNLPALSKRYHVYAVDCYGHGGSSRNSAKYSANAIGTDLAWFIRTVIKGKAVVSGHSSGGLLAVWLAANAPDCVAGVVLEDPPLFSCEDGRKEKAFNWNDLSTACHTFLNQTADSDFTLWYFKRQLWFTYLPENGKKMLCDMAEHYRKAHPHETLVLSLLPQSVMAAFNSFEKYDPAFGQTFYDGTWNKGFDHAEALARVKCPAVLIHAGFTYKDGILYGAMDGKDAERAHSLMPNSTLVEVDSMHAVHWLKPDRFNQIMIDFLKKIQ